MTYRRQREKIAKAEAKSNARRRVFTRTCECRNPQLQLAVHFGTFCMGCFHPVAPKEQKRRR